MSESLAERLGLSLDQISSPQSAYNLRWKLVCGWFEEELEWVLFSGDNTGFQESAFKGYYPRFDDAIFKELVAKHSQKLIEAGFTVTGDGEKIPNSESYDFKVWRAPTERDLVIRMVK